MQSWNAGLALLVVALAAAGSAAPSRASTPENSDIASVDTVVHAGTLMIDPRAPLLQAHSVLVRDGRIVAITPGYRTMPGATVVDLRDAFVLPGLIDLHVHLTTTPAPDNDRLPVSATDADLAVLALRNAQRNLAAGFTTVLDLGNSRRAHENAVYAVRRAIESGLVTGPRILAVGSPLAPPGSSRTSRYRAEVDAVVGPEGVCSGADDCRRVVREQVRRGADVISFYNTGSLLSDPSIAQTFTDAEMRAIVETAHMLGRKVIADGGNTPGDARGINAALRAGVDIIDTVTYPDADTWRLAAASAAWVVPHLYALQAAVGDTPETLERGTMGWLPRPVLESLYRLKQQTPSAVAGRRAGARFAFGSDPGVFPHGDNANEFGAYVRTVGLSPAESIATATVNAAAALGLEREIGRLAPGLAADLIATRRSPLEDIHELTSIVYVMRGGRAVDLGRH